MNKNQQKNGVTKLTEEQERMRMDVVDLELKARYWKAQYEIRDYTLKLADIEPLYLAHIKALNEMDKQNRDKFLAELEKANKLAEEGQVQVEEVQEQEA
jgi:hypothetical protein